MTEPLPATSEMVSSVRRLLRPHDPPGASLIPHDGDGALDTRVFNMRVALGALASPPASVARGGVVGRAGTLFKRMVRKATAWYVEPRWSAQAYFNEQVTAVASELDTYQQQVAHADADLEAQMAGLSEQLVDVLDQLANLRRDLGPADATAGIDYVAFEERFRGDSAEVKESQRDYVGRFQSATAGGPVVDIGCGRGEMLELLRDAGLEALGVDTDDAMLDVCRRKGLSVEHGDGLEWLRARGDGSLRGIFLAQVVEHLHTHGVVELIDLAARKISPGGALVVETIDPRSLFATANFFWADLSHVRPVHPATLSFLAEQAGFAEVGTVRRNRHELADVPANGDSGPMAKAVRSLLESVYGYQDYALIANR